jgi:hypothetical protein
VKNISNEERGRLLENIFNVDEPSPITTTRFKIEIACTHYKAIDILCL